MQENKAPGIEGNWRVHNFRLGGQGRWRGNDPCVWRRWQGLRRENSELKRMPCFRACLDRARESVESSVAAWKLGEYRVPGQRGSSCQHCALQDWNGTPGEVVSSPCLILERLCIITRAA